MKARGQKKETTPSALNLLCITLCKMKIILQKKIMQTLKNSLQVAQKKTQFSLILDADQEDILVSSSYGMLPKGSVISYHFPLKEVDNFCKLKDAPTFLAIPLYSLSRVYSTVLDRNSLEIFEENIVTEEEAISIESDHRAISLQSVSPL